MARISAAEFYDNKDIIQQIELLKDTALQSPIKSITAEQEEDVVTITFTMADGTEHKVSFRVEALPTVEWNSITGDITENEALMSELGRKQGVIATGTDDPDPDTGAIGDIYIKFRE